MTPLRMTAPLRAYVWWDYACPFSYVATARVARLRGEVPLDVVWRPLPLGAPGRSPGPRPAAVRGGRRGGEADPAAAAAELGLPFHPPDPFPDTRAALQAAEFARDLGAPHFERLHGILFDGVYGRGVDLGDREALLGLAGQAGLDTRALAAALEDGRYEPELAAAEAEAERYGIPGTPAFLFGRFLVVGAAPLPILRRAADRAVVERGG